MTSIVAEIKSVFMLQPLLQIGSIVLKPRESLGFSSNPPLSQIPPSNIKQPPTAGINKNLPSEPSAPDGFNSAADDPLARLALNGWPHELALAKLALGLLSSLAKDWHLLKVWWMVMWGSEGFPK